MSLFPDNTFQGNGRVAAEGRPDGHLAAFLTSLGTELSNRTLDADGDIDAAANENLDGDTPDVDARPRAVLADTSGGTVAGPVPHPATHP